MASIHSSHPFVIRIDDPNGIADISLIGIEVGPNADLDAIGKIVRTSSYAGITRTVVL